MGIEVVLVDGTYELFRSFYGAPSSIQHGREVGAVRGLVRSMRALLRHYDHVAIAFDTVIESFRNQLFAGYKTGDGIDPLLHAQFPLAEEAAEALGMTTLRMIDFEADDALATLAHALFDEPSVERIRIASPDKDLAQCVRGTRIVRWDRKDDRLVDEDGVREKMGISPGSVPDYLALVGDTADGIPGLPRWGEKSASKVLAKFGKLEAIPDRHEAWGLDVRGAAALAESLRSRRDDAVLYRTLAKLRTDVPIDTTLASLRVRGAIDRFAAVAETLGLDS